MLDTSHGLFFFEFIACYLLRGVCSMHCSNVSMHVSSQSLPYVPYARSIAFFVHSYVKYARCISTLPRACILPCNVAYARSILSFFVNTTWSMLDASSHCPVLVYYHAYYHVYYRTNVLYYFNCTLKYARCIFTLHGVCSMQLSPFWRGVCSTHRPFLFR